VPLSDDPAKRQRQLANLQPNARPAPVGNQHRRTHGGYARVRTDEIGQRAAELFDALAADAPLRDPDGELPPVDVAAVHLLARTLVRLERVEAHLDSTGEVDQRSGEPRHAVIDLEARLRREAAAMLDRLGMTPAARARLGLDLARTIDAAQVISEPDPERRRLMIEGGLDDR
jgi:hypothetical protein